MDDAMTNGGDARRRYTIRSHGSPSSSSSSASSSLPSSPSPAPITSRPSGPLTTIRRRDWPTVEPTRSSDAASSAMEDDALQRIGDDPRGYLGTDGDEDEEADEDDSEDRVRGVEMLSSRFKTIHDPPRSKNTARKGNSRAERPTLIEPVKPKRGEPTTVPPILRRPNTAGLPHFSSNDVPSGIVSPTETSLYAASGASLRPASARPGPLGQSGSSTDLERLRETSSSSNRSAESARIAPSGTLSSAIPLLRSLSSSTNLPSTLTAPRSSEFEGPTLLSSGTQNPPLTTSSRGGLKASVRESISGGAGAVHGSLFGYGSMDRAAQRAASGIGGCDGDSSGINVSGPVSGSRKGSTARARSSAGRVSSLRGTFGPDLARQGPSSNVQTPLLQSEDGTRTNAAEQDVYDDALSPTSTSRPSPRRSRQSSHHPSPSRIQSHPSGIRSSAADSSATPVPTPATSSILSSIRKTASSAGLSLRSGRRRQGGEYDGPEVQSPGLFNLGRSGSERLPKTAGVDSGHSRRRSRVSWTSVNQDGIEDGTGTGREGETRRAVDQPGSGIHRSRTEIDGEAWVGGARIEESMLLGEELDAGVRTNGVRVWYSSWTSIDWLHDQIKDSARVRRLRSAAKRSWRGWIRNAMDRSTAWILVTIIGVLVALVAFLVIRLETALFDLKDGFCPSELGTTRHRCANWTTWERYFKSMRGRSEGWPAFVTYLGIAMTLAITSSLMTVYITASTRFDEPDASDALLSSATIGPHPVRSDTNRSDDLRYKATIAGSRVAPKPLAYFAAGSGIPEIKTILQGYIIKGYLGFSTLWVKSVGLALSVASGLSLGKEGPFVHIATAVANCVIRNFAKYETNEAKKREICSAACAAGVSVAFGAPLGGTLFSWEEASLYYGPKVLWRSFFCAAVAALTLRALDPYHNGKLVLLELNYTRDHHSSSIYLVAIVMGVFGGLYGGVWNHLNLLWTRKVRNGTCLKRHPVVEVACVILVTTILSYTSSYGRMGGVEWVAYLFEECLPDSKNRLCVSDDVGRVIAILDIGWTLLVRAGLAAITFGVKLPAGIFVPSLAAGAAAGRMLGIGLHSFDQALPGMFVEGSIVPGVYALLGASAALAGVTRTTVSLVVIVAELTSSLDYVVPIAISVLVAKTVADSLGEDSIYELVINAADYPYLDAKKEHRMGSGEPMDIADVSIPPIRVDQLHTAGALRRKLQAIKALGHPDGCLPCLRAFEDGNVRNGLEVIGLLAVNELQYALHYIANDDAQCSFVPPDHEPIRPESSTWSESPLAVTFEGSYNLARYIDLAPLTVHSNAPLELVQQFFVKLGARCVVVADGSGRYQGLILKKAYLSFLSQAGKH